MDMSGLVNSGPRMALISQAPSRRVVFEVLAVAGR
jgi:hypothetical protein